MADEDRSCDQNVTDVSETRGDLPEAGYESLASSILLLVGAHPPAPCDVGPSPTD